MRRAERGPRQRKSACGRASGAILKGQDPGGHHLNKLSAWMAVPKGCVGSAVGLVHRGDNGREGRRFLQVFSGWGRDGGSVGGLLVVGHFLWDIG